MIKRLFKNETVKTLIIVLLLCTAILLAVCSGILSDIFAERSDTKAAPAISETIGAAELPNVISALSDSGVRKSAKYDRTELSRLYLATSAEVGFAIENASAPMDINLADFRNALTDAGIWYKYRTGAELNILGGWFGVTPAVCGDVFVDGIFVSPKGVYFAGDGRYIKCSLPETASFPDSESLPGTEGAVFCFELDVLNTGSADLLLFPDITSHQPYKASNPMLNRSNRDMLLAILDAAASANNAYSESDGTLVYVAGDFTLRISPDGSVLYRLTEPTEGEASAADSIERARRICTAAVLPFSGKAELTYSGCETADDGCTVYFDYILESGIAEIGSHAVEVLVSGGIVNEMRIRFLSFSPEGDPVEMMPEIIAAAASDCSLYLKYTRDGDMFSPIFTSEE